MKTRILFALSACLALPAAIATPASLVSETPYVEYQLPPPATDVPQTTCGGRAPAREACSMSGAAVVLTSGQFGTTAYTGTLVSTLTWTDGSSWGTYTIRCNYTLGIHACYHGPSDYPPVWPVWWNVKCNSYDLYTSTPGGDGQWMCNFVGVPTPIGVGTDLPLSVHPAQ